MGWRWCSAYSLCVLWQSCPRVLKTLIEVASGCIKPAYCRDLNCTRQLALRVCEQDFFRAFLWELGNGLLYELWMSWWMRANRGFLSWRSYCQQRCSTVNMSSASFLVSSDGKVGAWSSLVLLFVSYSTLPPSPWFSTIMPTRTSLQFCIYIIKNILLILAIGSVKPAKYTSAEWKFIYTHCLLTHTVNYRLWLFIAVSGPQHTAFLAVYCIWLFTFLGPLYCYHNGRVAHA